MSRSTASLSAQSFPSSSPVAYLARPPAPFRAAVLVVHDNFGLDGWIESLCDSLARVGFLAAAIDLYGGRVPTDFMEAHELERALPETDARAHILYAATYIRQTERPARLGILGIAMGGTLALDALAASSQLFDACVVNYAALPVSDSLVARLTCPIMLHIGEQDIGIDQTRVAQFAAAMRAHHHRLTVHSYPDAGFGFLRPNSDSFHPHAAALAWQRTVEFFKQHLFRSQSTSNQ